jgi:hypothetical protein
MQNRQKQAGPVTLASPWPNSTPWQPPWRTARPRPADGVTPNDRRSAPARDGFPAGLGFSNAGQRCHSVQVGLICPPPLFNVGQGIPVCHPLGAATSIRPPKHGSAWCLFDSSLRPPSDLMGSPRRRLYLSYRDRCSHATTDTACITVVTHNYAITTESAISGPLDM